MTYIKKFKRDKLLAFMGDQRLSLDAKIHRKCNQALEYMKQTSLEAA
jgi:hypothetical protein